MVYKLPEQQETIYCSIKPWIKSWTYQLRSTPKISIGTITIFNARCYCGGKYQRTKAQKL